MKATLFPTQVEDIAKMAGRTDLPNFSEPGTGKTITTMGAIEAFKLGTGLVICPSSAPLMWKENLEEQLGAKVQWLQTGKTVIDKTADILVTTYGVIGAHFDQLMRRNNGAVVLDESQNLKNLEAKRTVMVFGEAGDGKGGIYETSQQCFPLSGTPIERYADDLWSQLRATHPDALQEYKCLELKDFQMQFCVMRETNYGYYPKWKSFRNQNESLLNTLLYKRIGAIRRTMKDVAPYMPKVLPFREITASLTISGDLRTLLKYASKLSDEQLMQALADDDIQIAAARRLIGLAKIDSTIDYVMENIRGNNILLGYWFADLGRELELRLRGRGVRVARIGGDTSVTKRHEIRADFKRGKLQVIVGQIAAMGTAMDGLQFAARHVIFAEDEWSPGKVEQFYKRLARFGQEYPVQVDFMRSDNNIDNAVRMVRERKAQSNQEILDK